MSDSGKILLDKTIKKFAKHLRGDVESNKVEEFEIAQDKSTLQLL